MAWRRSDPLDPVTVLAVREESRAKQSLSADSTFAFSLALLLVLGLLFWGQTDHRGLVSWLVMTGLLSPGAAALRRMDLGFADWHRLSILHETLIGIVWGLAPILALPHDPAWQTLLGAVLGCVSLAGSITNASFLSLHLSYLTPYTVLASIGFALRATGPAQSFPFLFALAFAFGAVVAQERRALDRRMVETQLLNQALTRDLETEHQRLRHTLSELEQANQQLEQRARTDSLTGLENRLGFQQIMNQALDDLTCLRVPAVTIAFLDLDRFKAINDDYGHAAGDQVLQITTSRLKLATTTAEHLARLGGDEIVVISTTTDPDELGRRLIRAFAWPYSVKAHLIPITASIGIAITSQPITTDELLHQADTALYQAKAVNGTAYRISSITSSPNETPPIEIGPPRRCAR